MGGSRCRYRRVPQYQESTLLHNKHSILIHPYSTLRVVSHLANIISAINKKPWQGHHVSSNFLRSTLMSCIPTCSKSRHNDHFNPRLSMFSTTDLNRVTPLRHCRVSIGSHRQHNTTLAISRDHIKPHLPHMVQAKVPHISSSIHMLKQVLLHHPHSLVPCSIQVSNLPTKVLVNHLSNKHYSGLEISTISKDNSKRTVLSEDGTTTTTHSEASSQMYEIDHCITFPASFVKYPTSCFVVQRFLVSSAVTSLLCSTKSARLDPR